MREIKFRAWDLDCNNWFDNGSGFALSWDAIEIFDDNDHKHSTDNIVFQQYTGLKDKNGKDIYEGDVFQYIEHEGYSIPSFISAIKFIEEWACFGYETGSEVFGTRDVPFSEHDELQLDFLNHIEVIGDVYRNPEIINK